MAEPARKYKANARKRKDRLTGDSTPNLIEATLKMDFDQIQDIIELYPETISQLDDFDNNVMHLCVSGGWSRMSSIAEFFIESSDINLLHTNKNGDSPIDIAIAINDQDAIDFLWEPTATQLNEAYPEPPSDLRPV